MRTADEVYTEKVTEIVQNVTRLTQNNSVQWTKVSSNPDIFKSNFGGLFLEFQNNLYNNPCMVLVVSSTGITSGDCIAELDELRRKIYLQLEPWRGCLKQGPDNLDKILEKLSKA